MRREPDDGVWAEQGPRLGRGQVVLPDVDPVGVASARQVRIVVDDEEGAVVVAKAAEGLGGELDLAPRQGLLAQLHDVGAPAQRSGQERLGILAVWPRLTAEVEPRRAQPLTPQRSLALGWCQAHPTIIAL